VQASNFPRGDVMGETTAEDSASGSTVADEKLRALARLVGTWDMSGEATDPVELSGMEGEVFLIQRVQPESFGQRIDGIDIGTFSADDQALVGSWVYPGRGYESTMTRVREDTDG
jgi:hypothetical protein